MSEYVSVTVEDYILLTFTMIFMHLFIIMKTM